MRDLYLAVRPTASPGRPQAASSGGRKHEGASRIGICAGGSTYCHAAQLQKRAFWCSCVSTKAILSVVLLGAFILVEEGASHVTSAHLRGTVSCSLLF